MSNTGTKSTLFFIIYIAKNVVNCEKQMEMQHFKSKIFVFL